MTVEQLLTAVEDARAEGEKIVFTNGCFDILHAGSCDLPRAGPGPGRPAGGVNDDGSVSRLKGPGRPINSVDRRMAVLAGLEAVDWVVCFSEDTPENLLAQVRPDVLVRAATMASIRSSVPIWGGLRRCSEGAGAGGKQLDHSHRREDPQGVGRVKPVLRLLL